LLEIENEYKLLKLSKKLEKQNVRFVLFQEPDMGDEYTSLATEIIYANRRFLFKNLQLVKREKNNE